MTRPKGRRGLGNCQNLADEIANEGDWLKLKLQRARLKFLGSAGCFDQAWYESRCDDLTDAVDRPLHYLTYGAPAGLGPNRHIDALKRSTGEADNPPDVGVSARARLKAEMKLVAASGLFDAEYYLANNPAVLAKALDPLWHFCKRGWRQLRHPSRDFDLWWYWSCNLDPAQEAINPLVHFILCGQAARLSTRMPPYRPSTGHLLREGSRVHRICLLAGFDPHGIVDDHVVQLARELSRFADVYYLADCAISERELQRLEPWVAGRWAYRHETYDFGSWGALASKHVGWKAIGEADELLLVNDSGYLVRELQPVFDKMRSTACDWWGLQATKGMFATRDRASNAFQQPIEMTRVRSDLMDSYRDDYSYDFHIGSYFQAFRKPVIQDSGFRRRLSVVGAQSSKRILIRKCEIGLTQYLVGRQYAFDTFMEHLYPLHPLFTHWQFELILRGFPLFKRLLLVGNHYDVGGLADWRRMLLAAAPDAPLDLIEANLLRAADRDKLDRSFGLSEQGA